MGKIFFQFNKRFFKQIKGTSMGNPLSLFLGEIFKNRFETKLKKQSRFSK